jgi:hypothetical protein
MPITHIYSRGRIAVFALLALALLAGLAASRTYRADAATPLTQNSNTQSATFEQSSSSTDGCIYTAAWVSVNGAHSVANNGNGPASVTNQTVLNGYAETVNYCTNAYRYAEWDNVSLAPNQFRMDGALNRAVLSGAIPASSAYGCDADGNCDDDAGSPSFDVSWQRTGDQLITPSHTSSHTPGQDIVNVEFTGQSYVAQANGSIVVTGPGGGTVPVTSANDDFNLQDSAYLSNSMTVSVVVARKLQPIVIPAGHTLTISNVSLGCYDALTFGYQLDMGANVTVGGGRCAHPADTTIGPFAQDTQIRIWTTDTSAWYCTGYPASYTYYSDGLHALVTGTNPYQVDIMDSGVGCNVPADQLRLPSGPGQGNLTATLTISS